MSTISTPTDIPKGWENSNVGKIGVYINGKAFKPSEWQKTGIPIIRIQNLSDESNEFNYSKNDYDKKYEINDGDVLVSWSATLGCFKWNRGKSVLNQHIFKAIPNNDIHIDFFYYVLSNSIEKMKKRTHGSTMQHITLKPFLETEILLPGFQEQQKIASILSNINNNLEKSNQLIQKTKILKKAMMHQLFTKGINHMKLKKNIGLFGKEIEIPEDWHIKSLDDVGKIIGGGTPDSTNKNFWGGDIFWAVPKDVTKLQVNQIEDTERKITKLGLENSSAKILPKGTILITSRATIGKCAITTKPMSTNQGFQNIICNDEFDNYFIFYSIKYYLNNLVRLSQGTTFLEISNNQIKKIIIPIPKLLSEQQKISTILLNIDSQIESLIQYNEKLSTLKKSLTQKLLIGKIRVSIT